ncbi:MAG: glycoside hydrolase family 3 C-terminal domain-containing protein [Turicibacter sp.]|nr:glycoside hydrolase family 3 C-terminal domain-containing protein [Turicibacter sp.]
MRDLKKIISQMTLEEKVGLCSGFDFWRLKSIERLGIPTVMLSDGPHGLRKQSDDAEYTDINKSIEAICFPSGVTTACSFDRDLLYRLGDILGEECQSENVAVVLGPAINIKRSPLGGRNFEYFSEDPYLTGELALMYIKGVQSHQVGTSLKHFACNNQESRRMTASSEVDERTLREIYLAGFEKAVKEAKPWTVMAAYNRVNGVFASESPYLLTDILRKEWGFTGYVVSDWGAVNDRIAGLKAGLDLEMPGSRGTNDKKIKRAIENHTLDEEILDQSVERILTKIFEYVDNKKEVVFNKESHHQVARQLANESAVLLKNDGALPLSSTDCKIAFIGDFAKHPRIQGGGSSHIKAFKVSSALDAVSVVCPVQFAQGFVTHIDETEPDLLNEAIELAKSSDVAVIFAGLPDAFESEAYDRQHMKLPNCQNELIEKACAVQPNTIVVLHNGSPVEMPWVNKVNAILEMYLGGEAVGEATIDLLFGNVNPSGKLAETFPIRLEDNPSYLSYQVVDDKIYYDEKLFVGYRYYDTKEIPVLFPFGHGCSYTTFEYSHLVVNETSIRDDESLTLSFEVTNTGDVFGKEVVQLYVQDLTHSVIRPIKELKNFEKISLEPNETKIVTFTLSKRDFAYYETRISDWYVSTGNYRLLVGASSRDIRLQKTIFIESTKNLPFEITANTTFGDLMKHPELNTVISGLLEAMGEESEEGAISKDMKLAMIYDMPIRALRSFQGVDNYIIESLITTLNQLIK